jgi:hypothetical protein
MLLIKLPLLLSPKTYHPGVLTRNIIAVNIPVWVLSRMFSYHIKRIRRTYNLLQRRSCNMRINFGGFRACVSEQFLNVTQVDPVFEKVGGERVTRSVHGCMPGDVYALLGSGKYHLNASFCRATPFPAFEKAIASLYLPVTASTALYMLTLLLSDLFIQSSLMNDWFVLNVRP